MNGSIQRDSSGLKLLIYLNPHVVKLKKKKEYTVNLKKKNLQLKSIVLDFLSSNNVTNDIVTLSNFANLLAAIELHFE